MEITKHMFFNLSLIMIIIFVCLIWSLKRNGTPISKRAAVVCGVVSIWLCISFAYEQTDVTRFDLRAVPVVIGGLYMGIGPILSLSTIIIRALYGLDSGFFTSIILYGPLSFILWRTYPWFWKQGSKMRIVIAVGLIFIISVLTVTDMAFENLSIDRFDAFFAYLIVPPLGIGIISYLIELFRTYIQMRQQLFRTEKQNAVEQMGAAISHEIRNPLTVSKGFVQLLEEDEIPAVKRKEYLALIKEGLDSAEKVIQDYLTFSKPTIESMEELDVKLELEQIINILLPTANQNSVHFSTQFSSRSIIKGDRQKFRQCMLNIIKNGIESMPEGGYLSIVLLKERNHISIEIKDTGTGMTKSQLNRLGEPYYSTKGSNGTGLGTMVAFSIIRALGGTVEVKSDLGRGTTFLIKFPKFHLEH